MWTDSSFGSGGSLSVPKSITRTDAGMTKVPAMYVGPDALLPVGTRRAFLVSTYGSNDATRNDTAFYSVYLARFCLE